jgi:hypothetical protein
MTRKIFTLLLIVAGFMSANAQSNICQKATTVPVIDGYIDTEADGWGNFTDLAVRNPAGTTTAASAKFSLMKDANNFYVAIVVQDATPYNDATAIPNSYERDNTEIFFAMDTVTEPSAAFKTGCWQVRCQREGETLIDGGAGGTSNVTTGLLADPNFLYASETASSEYVQEFQFPIATLIAGMDPAWDGQFFKFDIASADNSTGLTGSAGRTEQHYWYGTNGLGDDSGWHNTLALAICKVPGEVGVKSIKAGQASAFVSNNVLTVKNAKGIVSIYDIKGSIVRKSVINGNGTISVADLKSGVYVVKGTNLAEKFVK